MTYINIILPIHLLICVNITVIVPIYTTREETNHHWQWFKHITETDLNVKNQVNNCTCKRNGIYHKLNMLRRSITIVSLLYCYDVIWHNKLYIENQSSQKSILSFLTNMSEIDRKTRWMNEKYSKIWSLTIVIKPCKVLQNMGTHHRDQTL